MSKLELIIFDCDGVLVDSEALAAELMRSTLAKLGLKLTVDQTHKHFRGHSMVDCVAILRQDFAITPPADFAEVFDSELKNLFDSQLQAIDGVEQALQAIKIKKCVASSGSHKKILHSLQLTALQKYFSEHIFSAEDVVHGKPAPDLFLHAANSMGVSPAQCCVIEDSRPGVTAAIDAGMHVLVYTEYSRWFPKHVCCFSQMHELPGLISNVHTVI